MNKKHTKPRTKEQISYNKRVELILTELNESKENNPEFIDKMLNKIGEN